MVKPQQLTALERDAMLYARTGKTEKLAVLLSESVIPATWTAPDASCSLLTLAAQRGHLETMASLLERGADPDWVGYDGCALDEAANWTRKEAILLLQKVTSPAVIRHSAESLKQILQPVLAEGQSLECWRVTEPTGDKRLEVSDRTCPTAPIPSPSGFREYGSVLEFGGETLQASLVDYGRIRIGVEGLELGALSISDHPLHLGLELGLYALIGLEPSAFTLRFSYPGCAIRNQNFPRAFLIESCGTNSDWLRWGEPTDVPVPNRIVGVMAAGVWRKLRELARDDDRFWDYLFYSATGTCTNIWSPAGIEINSFNESDAIVFEMRENCRLWEGFNRSGKTTSVLLVCW